MWPVVLTRCSRSYLRAGKLLSRLQVKSFSLALPIRHYRNAAWLFACGCIGSLMLLYDLFLTSLITLLFSLRTKATTGCFSALGTGIMHEDCLRVKTQRLHPPSNVRTDIGINFLRCNGQNSYCDPSFAFSVPQGSAFGTCALGFDLLGHEPNTVNHLHPVTWDQLEGELSNLVRRCVDEGGGLGGNHTWDGFVFVLTNPTQVDTSHTCLALPGPEDYLDLGQCIARRAQLAAKSPSGGLTVATGQESEQPRLNLELLTSGASLAGHKKGGAWMTHKSGERSSTGYWTLLKGGMSTHSSNFAGPPFIFDGTQWQAFNGQVFPRSGAMIRVPDHLLRISPHNVLVWHNNIWIPDLDSTRVDHSRWWVFVTNQWVPLTPDLVDAAEWLLLLGGWRAIAGSWFYAKSVPRESIQELLSASSSVTTASSHTLVSPTPMRIAQPQMTTVISSLAHPLATSNPTLDVYMRFQGIGQEFLTRWPRIGSTTAIPNLLQPSETSNPILEELRMMQGIAYFDFLTQGAQPQPILTLTQPPGTPNSRISSHGLPHQMDPLEFLRESPDDPNTRAAKQPRTRL